MAKTGMARTSSSRRWLTRQATDPYVKEAHRQGYRSRAAFKLLEIDERDPILRPGGVIIDLGAAPGGWSQVAAQRLAGNGRIIAVDILPLDPISGVEFLQGDFREQPTLQRLLQTLGGERATLVMSDMAPNASGVRAVDQPRALDLAELALDLAQQVLTPGGDFLVKVFQGEGTDRFIKDLRGSFQKVLVRKPRSSRPGSRELYTLARHFLV
jgi:23S rRNA (uridine2552-2'-O)-methyltransferase